MRNLHELKNDRINFDKSNKLEDEKNSNAFMKIEGINALNYVNEIPP